LNHTSIVVGARYSGAKIKVFKHGDMKSLESTIRQSIIEGQPKSHRPWTKIVILVEGIYSMEGDMCPLPQIVALKKKYNCYLYVDEAHSIGALGPQGRGICNQLGVNPADIDVLMGTFTKSFGAVGGYVAGSRELIDYLKRCCAGSMYSNSISPPAVQQIISALTIILGEDGTDLGKRKIAQLKDNSNYFRKRLIEMGLHVIGQSDSPIVPVMIFHPTKIAAFSRECFKLGLATVVVGYPATPLLLSRARFCISAGHTREDLDFALEQIQKVAARVHLRYKHYLNG
jgi:serine palmitoyltransferase